MGVFKDLSGERFDMLFVECRVENNKHGDVCYQCICDCGNRTVVSAHNLRNGNTHSCGCLKKKIMAEKQFKHGEAGGRKKQPTRLYRIWQGINSRCYIPSATEYENYGGRGIVVCDDWKNDYEAFKRWALSNGYMDELTIDRKDNNGNYSPDNCHWITKKQQMLNKRNNRLLTYNNQTKTITEWSNETGIDRRIISTRIDIYKWAIERALTTPIRGRCS